MAQKLKTNFIVQLCALLSYKTVNDVAGSHHFIGMDGAHNFLGVCTYDVMYIIWRSPFSRTGHRPHPRACSPSPHPRHHTQQTNYLTSSNFKFPWKITIFGQIKCGLEILLTDLCPRFFTLHSRKAVRPMEALTLA